MGRTNSFEDDRKNEEEEEGPQRRESSYSTILLHVEDGFLSLLFSPLLLLSVHYSSPKANTETSACAIGGEENSDST